MMLPKILKRSTAAARAAEISAKLDAARVNLAEREATKATASAAAETALAALDAAALAVARRAFEIAEADHRDALALFGAASAALDAAEAEAAADRWRADAAAYRSEVEAFERATRADLGTMGEIARRIVAASVALEARKRELDGRRPVGETAVPSPEGWRGVPAEPDEVIDEKVEDAWFDEGADRPLIASVAATVIAAPGGRTGTRHAWGGAHVPAERRRIRRRVIRERSSPIHAEPLASALSVPGVTAGDRPGWRPTEPDLVATALEALAAPRSKPERPTREVVDILE